MLKRIPIFWKLSVAFMIILSLIIIISLYLPSILPINSFWHTKIIIALIIISSFVSSWFLVGIFIKQPLSKITTGMNKLADKKFDYRLEEDDADEFGNLAISFNDMADMLTFFMAELKKARDYLEGILESTADIIITVNSTGKILTMNTGAEEALGYNRNEMFGKPIEMLFINPADRERALRRLANRKSVVNYETQFRAKSGEAHDVLLTLSRMSNPSGEIIGTLGISKDITEEKRLQKQLIQSQRLAAIGEVFTGIQHSMKNMLNALKGGAYMVKTGIAKDNRKMLTEGWDIVQEGITKLTTMSLDMLKYVKEWKPRIEQVNISQILSDINQVIEQSAKDKGVDFQLKDITEVPPVACDVRMIHSAVMDIVSNAVDACLWKEYKNDEIPYVTLSAHLNHNGENAIIEVNDNGCGMSDEVKANIFTPFFSTKSKAGTGLGLSITSRMIEVHKGKIEVESEPDKGTTFRIVIPIDASSANKENNYGKESFSS